MTWPAAPNVFSSQDKASQRFLLDLKASIPRPLKEATIPSQVTDTINVLRTTWRRSSRRTKWSILSFVTLMLLFTVFGLPFRGGSHDADAQHLDQLVRRLRGDQSDISEIDPRAIFPAPDDGSDAELVPAAPEAAQMPMELEDNAGSGSLEAGTNDGDDDDDDAPSPEVITIRTDPSGREVPDYRELFSLTTRDRKYFLIWFDGEAAYNPNLIPHPTKADSWIVVAQHERGTALSVYAQELMCTAGFMMGVLVCDAHPEVVPVAPSIVGNCHNELDFANRATGPRDARMFYGPGEPYFMYGSQSSSACLGLWLQDARMVLDGFRLQQSRVTLYRDALELHRPEPWHQVEKNFFLFWDARGMAYVHHDLWPNRVFAQLGFDGSVGPDLAGAAAGNDSRCMASFMPSVKDQGLESLHQATNSLSITLCKRADLRCVPNDDNTFIIHIFHHKTFYNFHGLYEPYVVLFRRNFPFALHAISQRPFWIHGRTDLTPATDSVHYREHPQNIPMFHSEMFYLTSMSWKSHGQKYHGYLDDVMFLAFGVEDSRAGAIDVEAGDLLQDLAYCELAMPD